MCFQSFSLPASPSPTATCLLYISPIREREGMFPYPHALQINVENVDGEGIFKNMMERVLVQIEVD